MNFRNKISIHEIILIVIMLWVVTALLNGCGEKTESGSSDYATKTLCQDVLICKQACDEIFPDFTDFSQNQKRSICYKQPYSYY